MQRAHKRELPPARRHWLVTEIRGVRKFLKQLNSATYRAVPEWRRAMRRHYKARLTDLRKELNALK